MKKMRPDPASHFQPEGVGGPYQIFAHDEFNTPNTGCVRTEVNQKGSTSLSSPKTTIRPAIA